MNAIRNSDCAGGQRTRRHRALRLAWGALASMLVGACGGGGDSAAGDSTAPPAAPAAPTPPPAASGDFVVDAAIADALVAKGIPRDAAEFLASAKLQATSAEPTKVGYLQTFPNGATRAVTVTYVIDQSYAPSDDEAAAAAAAGGMQLYAKSYATSSVADVVENQLQYFVPYDAMSDELRASLQSARASAPPRERAQAAEQSGATVYVIETVKEGADVGIGSLLDYVKDHGMPKTGKSLGALFTFMSALSDVSS